MNPFPTLPVRLGLLAVSLTLPALAQDPKESDYYPVTTFEPPAGVIIEGGGIEPLPDGRLAVCTRRGQVWVVSGASDNVAGNEQYKLFGTGMHETLGLAYRDGWLYVMQRSEITRLKDLDGDDRADVYETWCDDFGLSGDYHEYNFMSKFDADGNLYIVLCLTGSFNSNIEFRGWCMKVDKDGRMSPYTCGIRSPGGIGFGPDGALYYTDNQGPWNGSSSLKHLVPGSFQGHPGGNSWFSITDAIGPRPVDPLDKSRMVIERDRVKTLVPPALMLAHGKLGQSPTGIVWDGTGGKFGPFQKQIFVGEQTYSEVHRVFVEEVNGVRQGAAFRFVKGLKSGIIGTHLTQDGQLFVTGSDRGWGARGGKPWDFEKITWTGKVPFEVHEMRAKPDGFELTFTEPVDAATAGNPASYAMDAWTYIYRAEYGSPEVDATKPVIQSAQVAADGKSVRLVVSGLVRGHVHDLKLPGVRSKSGLPLLHPEAWYTLNEIPKG
jgi:glucose/arabinose dehydrogenase